MDLEQDSFRTVTQLSRVWDVRVAVDYVTKPFSPVIIKARVNTHIQLYRYQMGFRNQAMVDELTGVSNRRYMVQRRKALDGAAEGCA